MSEMSLEERVAHLESELKQVKSKLASWPPGQDWRSTFGAFANDPLFDEIVKAGREYRATANQLPDQAASP